MEFVLPAIISSIATLLAVWLQSVLNRKRTKNQNNNFLQLINSDKVKKFFIVVKDEKDGKEIFVSKASLNEKDLELTCGGDQLKVVARFSDEKHLNYKNMGIIKDFSEYLNERFNNV